MQKQIRDVNARFAAACDLSEKRDWRRAGFSV